MTDHELGFWPGLMFSDEEDDDWLTDGLPQTTEPNEEYQSAQDRLGAER